MTPAATCRPVGDGRLWAIALMLSLVVNVAILALAGFTILKTQVFRKSPTVTESTPQQPPSVTTVKILLEMAAANSSLAEANRNLERKIDQRTAQLEAANRRLSAEITDSFFNLRD